MTDFQRTHTCNELRPAHIDETVRLSGWVHRRRDHGGLIFIDLRDRYGLTQLTLDPNTHPEAQRLRSEWCITIQGTVLARGPDLTNTKLATGEIEVTVTDLTILSRAKTPPFSICDERIEVSDDLRLQYRYLDIRRGRIAHNLRLRHRIMQTMRNRLTRHDFIEVHTPTLGKSTPEGARDYLVPSRVHPGSFYALPQSPQLYKQLLMVSGLDRYFQIAPCYRDEDLRADRQPEFHQLDIELSFETPATLFSIIEELMSELFPSSTFPHLTHAEALRTYGTDKPDLRFDMPLIPVDDIAAQSDFTVFRSQIESGGIVKAICVKNGDKISRKQIDNYTSFISQFGPKGLAWMRVTPEGLQSNIVKFFSPPLQAELITRTSAEPGDLLLFVADQPAPANQALDHLRRSLARDLDLIPPNTYAFAWITEFPLFHFDKNTNRLVAEHHPFTAPHPDDLHLLETDPLKIRSSSYDLVLNGYELGSGSPRIYDPELQRRIFNTLQLSDADIDELFGFFVDALQYGTPPHLGIALGLDRVAMILAKSDSIRDVIAFPKTQRATDLMTQAPAPVLTKQLDELRLRIED